MDFLIDLQSSEAVEETTIATETRSPRESLLNEAWERRRGRIIRSRSAKNSSSTATSQPCQRTMSRSISLFGNLSTSATAAGGHPRRPHIISLTDDDFEELKGCLELGFAFDEESIPELTHILPALSACYSLSSSFKNGHHLASPTHTPSPTWKLFEPDDHPHDIKEQLRHWAQAVACNVRISYQEQQCSREE